MFTQRISMDCTQEQYEKHLKDELLKMGYREIGLVWGFDKNIIVNNWAGYMGLLTSLTPSLKDYKGRLYLGSFNPELFLALAAMTDNPNILGYGEYMTNEKYKILRINEWNEHSFVLFGCHKSTKEEIMERFGNNKEPMWKSYSNTTKNLEEIYTAIELLKSKGYKILKPKTWEEV